VLRFCASPVAYLGEGHLDGVRLARNALVRDERGAVRAVPSCVTEDLAAGVVLEAIGYTGTPLPGVPFDARRGLIAHDGSGRLEPGVYVAGWAKRGASGVIGTNKKCAKETVDALLADVDGGALAARGTCPTGEEIEARLRERVGRLVTYRDWQGIDAHERAMGRADGGRPRVKLTRREELLAFAGRG
jgi:ferredoxin--NADP+ reductase